MQNIKTGIVVALLLAVCYGAFKALNEPEAELPPELNEWVSNEGSLDALLDDVELGDSGMIPSFEPDLPQIPGTSTPLTPGSIENGFSNMTPSESGLSVPDLKKIEPKKNEPINPSTHILGGTPNTSIENKTDGPALKIPNELDTAAVPSAESDSLVPDAYPSIPIAASDANSSPTISNAASPSNSDAAETPFPSIQLPNANTSNGDKTKFTGVISGDTGTRLPLLPDVDAVDQSVTQSAETKNPLNSPAETPVLQEFSMARESALKLAKDGKLKEALVLLTPYYGSPVISSPERSDLLDILDALAREVIFSQRHLRKPAYVATATDTVESVATQHKITPELLTNINQLGNAKALIKGQQLKVLEGPFRGEVDLAANEVTLYLNDMYACRFPISIGSDPVKVGSYEVAEKRRDRTYFAAGKVIEATNPSNPYGGYWIDLGHDVCLHGSPEMATTDLQKAGCISLAPIDIADAYIMLTRGSQISIRR